jgi:RHS repeat-associated protein
MTWNLTYNADKRSTPQRSGVGNRAQSIGNRTYGATYLNDCDGVRVGQMVNGAATFYFAGGAYEVNGIVSGSTFTETKHMLYFSIAGQMIASDDGSGLQYFLTDHLGSMVGVMDASGTLLSQQRYLPFGQVRASLGTITQTDYGYTGQRKEGYTGLMDYKARFYDGSLGRFLQPDSIVPNPANPQSINRYSYVMNNSINNNDPSGHVICTDDGYCGKISDYGYQKHVYTNAITDVYKWNLKGNWNLKELEGIYNAGYQMQTYLDKLTGGNGLDWLNKYLGETNIAHSASGPSWVPRDRDSAMPSLASGNGGNTVFLFENWQNQNSGSRWITHEMGHIWDINSGTLIPGIIYGGIADQENAHFGGTNLSNPFVCRFCNDTGPGNTNPWAKGLYGNNSSADYQAESFAVMIYQDHPMPFGVQDWMQLQIIAETVNLIFPPGAKY